MYQGSSKLILDGKGRMSVPARHRDALALQCEGRLTLTKHPEGCLLMFPRPVWESHREKIAAWPMNARTWQRILDVNLTGTFLMTRAALPHLMSSKGAIVNAASTSSFYGHPWMAAYASSKGAIAALTQTLAVEYCKEGVRVNAVAPGSVHSGITGNVEFPTDLTKEEGKLVRRIMSPTGFGDPADVASVVAMLLSDDGRHITGEVIRIDGGTHA